MRLNVCRPLVGLAAVLTLGGCSFLSAEAPSSSTTSTVSTSTTARPPASSATSSLASGSATTSPATTGATAGPANPLDGTFTASASTTATLADPTGGSTSPSAAALPMSIKDKQSHSAALPAGTREITARFTCSPKGSLTLDVTFDSRTSPQAGRSVTTCEPDQAVSVSMPVPADASRVTVKASAADQFWVVIQGQ